MEVEPPELKIAQKHSKNCWVALKRSESIELVGTAIPENMSRIGAVWRFAELEIHPNPGFRFYLLSLHGWGWSPPRISKPTKNIVNVVRWYRNAHNRSSTRVAQVLGVWRPYGTFKVDLETKIDEKIVDFPTSQNA